MRTTACWCSSIAGRDFARHSRPRLGATAARTRSARRFSKRSASCAPKSSPRCTASTEPSSISPALASPAPAVRTLRLNLAGYDGLLGKTYSEIGTEARSMHKCQGMAQLLALPGPSATQYQLVESTLPDQVQRDETSLFDGIDTTIPGLAQLAGSSRPEELADSLAAIESAVQTAQ